MAQFFYPHLIETVIGGRSALDLPQLEVQSLEQAYQFVKSYGYDLNEANDLEEIWSIHRRAVALIREELLDKEEEIPPELTDPTRLQDIAYLLVYASSKGEDERSKSLQRWSCAILRVMHVMTHIENDIFTHYSEQIQEQMLKPIREHMLEDPVAGTVFGLASDVDQIPLYRFDVKPFKGRTSAVIKLLSKPQAVAFNLLDRMGVRFVTKTLVDAFRIVRLLHRENIISFPNVMPDQSRNTLYPMNLFDEVASEIKPGTSNEDIYKLMLKKLELSPNRAEFVERPNEFSSSEYKVIKFISRRLIEVMTGAEHFHFFFPLEIQIIDYENYLQILSGPGSHEQYKKRQREAARRRVLAVQKK